MSDLSQLLERIASGIESSGAPVGETTARLAQAAEGLEAAGHSAAAAEVWRMLRDHDPARKDREMFSPMDDTARLRTIAAELRIRSGEAP